MDLIDEAIRQSDLKNGTPEIEVCFDDLNYFSLTNRSKIGPFVQGTRG
jgi:hypothetical protein